MRPIKTTNPGNIPIIGQVGIKEPPTVSFARGRIAVDLDMRRIFAGFVEFRGRIF